MQDIEELRDNICDPNKEKYTDEKLQQYLEKYQDINYVSGLIWNQYAGNAALRHFKFKTKDSTVDKTMTAKECRLMAKEYIDIYKMTNMQPADAVVEIDWNDMYEYDYRTGPPIY